MPPKAFKPPRHTTSTAVKKPTKTKSTTARTSTSSTTKPRSTTSDKGREKAKGKSRGSTFKVPARLSGLPSLSSDSDAEAQSDPFASPTSSRAASPSQIEIDSQEPDPSLEEEERREGIPHDLLTRLLHENFKVEGTRLSRDASSAIGKYMEVFVREALARAAFARIEVEGEGGAGFLEVEDLEKGGPQLLLDF